MSDFARYIARVRSAAAGAAVLSVGLLLSACGGDDDGPDVLPPITSSPSVTSVAPTSPVSAFPDTPQGAAAFARFVYAEISKAYASKDPSTLQEIMSPDCDSCANFIRSVTQVRDQGLTVTNESVEVVSAETPGGQSGLINVSVRLQTRGIRISNDAGEVLLEEQPKRLQDRMVLQRRNSAFVVAEIERF